MGNIKKKYLKSLGIKEHNKEVNSSNGVDHYESQIFYKNNLIAPKQTPTMTRQGTQGKQNYH